MRDLKSKTSRLATTGLILLLGIALVACAPARKYQTSIGIADYLGEGVASCQAKASDLMRRELLLDQSYVRSKGDALEASFARYDARKQRQRFFENCMAQRAPKPVSVTPKN